MPFAVMIDGVLVPPERAQVSVFDRGFLYGDSVFETIRTYDAKPFALGEHLERLRRSAELVHIELPVQESELTREISLALAEANNPESYIRVMITRGQSELGLAPSEHARALRVIIVGELSPPAPVLYAQGAAAVSYATLRPSDLTSAQGAKIGNYLVAVMAMRVAREHDAHEALIVDQAGHVVEGASSNLFYVKDGVVRTPPEEAGILLGITRSRAITAARSLGLLVEFRAPNLAELLDADEVFISSSIRELMPIVSIDGQAIGGGRPGPVTQEISNSFRALVRGSG